MQQKVKNISYLCKVEFGLDEEGKQLVALPQGAEVLRVNLEIAKPQAGASLDIGFKDEEDYFMNDIPGDTAGFHNSEKLYCAKVSTTINATIVGFDKDSESKAILRVHYFVPSEVVLEV
ncbi:hypothetical protein [Helicobacter ailurogastricus]|uniref:hypothetical protein n=1 Tax=Helicobacter ailurogastricus TaxID=1578720 RepID=UPI000CF0BC9B|nr:hypothetical protein [Helicobacter ailurogastricus]